MTGWIVLGSMLLVLFLLSLLRLGVEFSYGEDGFRFRVRAGQIRVTLYPRKKRRPKKKKPSKKKQAQKKRDTRGKKLAGTSRKKKKSSTPPTDQAKTQGQSQKDKPPTQEEKTGKEGGLPLPLMDLISLVLEAASEMFARLQIDTLEIGYTIAGKDDPAWAAIQYGLICAGEGGLVPVLENSFYCIKHRDIRARVDFESRTSLIWLKLALSIRLGQLLSVACRIFWALLKVYRQNQTDSAEKQQEGN